MIELCVVQGRPSGKRLSFPPGDYLIGRGEECHVRPDSDWVSRQHCRLRVTTEGASICDLGSRNGTLVNGDLVRVADGERPLKHGDKVQIGPLVFAIYDPQASAGTPPGSAATSVPQEGAVELGAAPESTSDTGDTQPMQVHPLRQFQPIEDCEQKTPDV
jgi:pSer/pThr/pTyr-binding forkhead associated (FHA) protein